MLFLLSLYKLDYKLEDYKKQGQELRVKPDLID
jgi:hypothetical protein